MGGCKISHQGFDFVTRSAASKTSISSNMKVALFVALALASVVYGVEEAKASLRGVSTAAPALEAVKEGAASAAVTSSKRRLADDCGTVVRPDDFDDRVERGSIFNPLSTEEINSVIEWLVNESDLNVKLYDEADLYSDNYITYVYLSDPKKADALAYLEGGDDRPGRYAHVHLSMAALDTPAMRQYRVGPLPISTDTHYELLTFGGVTDVPFDARPTDTKEYDHLDELVLDVMGQINDEMRESFGTNYYAECPDEFCLTWSDTAPRGPKRDITMWFLFDVEAFFANPIGFYLSFRMSELDPTMHELVLIVYNGQAYDTIAEFKAAYANGSLKKLSNMPLNQFLVENSHGVDWASQIKHPYDTSISTGRGEATRVNSDIPAPEVHEPGGKRFSVEDGHVDYLGWSFNVGHDPIGGVKIHNLRYRGDQVAYEIALSEAIAVYSGVNDLVQAATIYGDTHWGLGASVGEFLLGVDCPTTGVLLNATFLMDGAEPTTKINSICIFEGDAQIPLRRHSNGDDYAGLGTHYLIVRQLLPVYNYDYIVDYVFHINGALEIRSATSGYLQSTFWSPELEKETKKFGHRIGPFTAGTHHDHVLSFKIDMDVMGTTNSLVRATTKVVSASPQDLNGKKYKLSNFEVATDFKTKKVVFDTVKTEAGISMSGSTMYEVVAGNGDKNAWNDRRRGYRLKLNGAIENPLARTKSLRAYSFSKYTFAATVRHEDEPTVSSIYDQSDTTGTIMASVTPAGAIRPHIDMDRYLANKETLAESDLVLWVNVGVHHIVQSGDIPVTTTNGNTVNIWLLPMNLFDYDDSMDMGGSLYKAPGGDIDYFDLKSDAGDLCPLAYELPGRGYIGE